MSVKYPIEVAAQMYPEAYGNKPRKSAMTADRTPTTEERVTLKIWTCKVGECESGLLLDGADLPMREAVARAYFELTGQHPTFIFSGWGGTLDEPERAVVENRLPSAEYEAEWHAKHALESEAARLRKALAEAERDARRWQWVEAMAKEDDDSRGWTLPGIQGAPSLETLGEVIDAALSQEPRH